MNSFSIFVSILTPFSNWINTKRKKDHRYVMIKWFSDFYSTSASQSSQNKRAINALECVRSLHLLQQSREVLCGAVSVKEWPISLAVEEEMFLNFLGEILIFYWKEEILRGEKRIVI